jgi:hypothetical protein
MTIGSIILGLALVILVGIFVIRPLLVPEQQRRRRLSRRQMLETEKEALVAQIRLLDLDVETGKMPEEVYQQQRGQLMDEAAAVLQQLDELAGERSTVDAGAGPVPADPEAAVEAAIARRRGARAVAGGAAVSGLPAAGPDAAIEAAVARRRQKAPASPEAQPQETPPVPATAAESRASNGKAGFCPQCGQPTDAGDRFCAHCGHRLSQIQPA